MPLGKECYLLCVFRAVDLFIELDAVVHFIQPWECFSLQLMFLIRVIRQRVHCSYQKKNEIRYPVCLGVDLIRRSQCQKEKRKAFQP